MSFSEVIKKMNDCYGENIQSCYYSHTDNSSSVLFIFSEDFDLRDKASEILFIIQDGSIDYEFNISFDYDDFSVTVDNN